MKKIILLFLLISWTLLWWCWNNNDDNYPSYEEIVKERNNKNIDTCISSRDRKSISYLNKLSKLKTRILIVCDKNFDVLDPEAWKYNQNLYDIAYTCRTNYDYIIINLKNNKEILKASNCKYLKYKKINNNKKLDEILKDLYNEIKNIKLNKFIIINQ